MAHTVAPADTVDGQAPSLADWVRQHGPLAADVVALLALSIAIRSSRLTGRELADAIDSLQPSSVVRRAERGWHWTMMSAPRRSHRVSDAEVLSRIGLIMTLALTGERIAPFASEPAIRATLRERRPDLNPAVVNLVAMAEGQPDDGLTLNAFAQDLRRQLNLGRRPPRGTRRAVVAATAAALVIVGSLGARYWTEAENGLEPHGLTSHEATVLDITYESAQTFALAGEHTAAIQILQNPSNILRARLSAQDPRRASIQALEAWVRTLAGDRLTTEQILERHPAWFTTELGDGHPYTRAARLMLAATLEERGAVVDARALREQAVRANNGLLPSGSPPLDLLPTTPVAPGVIAHMAPIDPVREGFRPQSNGAYHAPLMSPQRWLAERGGWRLHVVARDTCHVTTVVGIQPRRVGVALVRTASGWELQVDGITPRLVRKTEPTELVILTMAAGSSGEVAATFGDGPKAHGRIDPASPVSVPPHALTFEERGSNHACALVWMEISFPSEPNQN